MYILQQLFVPQSNRLQRTSCKLLDIEKGVYDGYKSGEILPEGTCMSLSCKCRVKWPTRKPLELKLDRNTEVHATSLSTVCVDGHLEYWFERPDCTADFDISTCLANPDQIECDCHGYNLLLIPAALIILILLCVFLAFLIRRQHSRILHALRGRNLDRSRRYICKVVCGIALKTMLVALTSWIPLGVFKQVIYIGG